MQTICKLLSDYGLESRVATHDYLAPAWGFEKYNTKEFEIYRMQLSHSAFKIYQPELLGLYVNQTRQDYIIDYFINRLTMEVLIEDLEPRNMAKLYRTTRNLMKLFPGD